MKIALAGASGNLGGRIAKALSGKAELVPLVRDASKPGVVIDYRDVASAAKLLAGVDCVISALQGLRDVIVETQSALLEAAIAAGVPRFIPSDFSTDYTKLPVGENRNFDFRRELYNIVGKSKLRATSIFNGAFAEILTYNVPILDMKTKTVAFWGDADWQLDFTTMDDTAAYTAAAALDPTTPRNLRIASFQISPREIAAATGFALKDMGSVEAFSEYIKHERAAHPEGEAEAFPNWQRMQYMHGMFSTHHDALDNARYDVAWTPFQKVVAVETTR